MSGTWNTTSTVSRCAGVSQTTNILFSTSQAVVFDQSLPISKARKDADQQLAVRIHDAGLRAWLLMNMKQDPHTKQIGWRINLDGIHSAFYKNIAKFPEVSGTFNRWDRFSSIPSSVGSLVQADTVHRRV